MITPVPVRGSFSLHRCCVIATGLILLTALAFLPVLRNGFVSLDDTQYITGNQNVRQGLTLGNLRCASTAFVMGNWHPATWLPHLIDHRNFLSRLESSEVVARARVAGSRSQGSAGS